MTDFVLEVIDDVHVLEIATQGPQGPPGSPGDGVQVFNEIPTGAINGVNATFTTSFSFIPESVAVYINGLRQKVVEDYNTSGDQTILMSVSPETGTNFLIDYIRS